MCRKNSLPHTSQGACKVYITGEARPTTRVGADAENQLNVHSVQPRIHLVLEVLPSGVSPGLEGVPLVVLDDINIKQPDCKCVSGELSLFN